jgi:hypothetical protein
LGGRCKGRASTVYVPIEQWALASKSVEDLKASKSGLSRSAPSSSPPSPQFSSMKHDNISSSPVVSPQRRVPERDLILFTHVWQKNPTSLDNSMLKQTVGGAVPSTWGLFQAQTVTIGLLGLSRSAPGSSPTASWGARCAMQHDEI